jgi:hypothetical protein
MTSTRRGHIPETVYKVQHNTQPLRHTFRESVDYFHYAFSVSGSSSVSKLNETGDSFECFAIALHWPATFIFLFMIYAFSKMCLSVELSLCLPSAMY